MCGELIIAMIIYMWYSLRVFTIDNCSNYWQEEEEGEERERRER